MDNDLRNGLWNALVLVFWALLGDILRKEIPFRLLITTWVHFYKTPVDEMPAPEGAVQRLKADFFSWPWNEVYDYLELVATSDVDYQRRQEFVRVCNAVLQRELAGYRFVDQQILPIGTAEELAAIEQARRDASQYPGVREHLRQAASLLADRTQPDVRNSVKESISAVEAACELITGQRGSLGECLKRLPPGPVMHPAFRDALAKLYGWSSDAQGIRHALMAEPNMDTDDARFMLVICSAFVSWLLSKATPAKT